MTCCSYYQPSTEFDFDAFGDREGKIAGREMLLRLPVGALIYRESISVATTISGFSRPEPCDLLVTRESVCLVQPCHMCCLASSPYTKDLRSCAGTTTLPAMHNFHQR